jgi:hypothetical protein
MRSLADLELLLPQLPTEEEWMKTISELEGSEKEAAIVRAKGYNLLADFQESNVSFERVGWLNSWSKTMTALESAISAFQYGSDWVLQTISRATFEWWLHILVIIEPMSDLIEIERSSHKVVVSRRTHEYAQRETIERLRAYAAWCLWKDKIHFSERLHPKTLEAAWDPKPAKEILSDEEELEKYEMLFGKLESETDTNKLKQGRVEQERILKDKMRRIDQWLKDSQIEKWHDRMLDVARKNKGAVSFFNLFDPNDTIIKRLHKHGLRFAYTQYSASSMGLHGSTMEQFIHINESVVTPKLQMNDKADETLFNGVISDCNRLFVLLGMINHFVLKNENVRS